MKSIEGKIIYAKTGGLKRYKNQHDRKDLFNFFKENNPSIDINSINFINIIKEFNTKLMDEIIINNYRFELFGLLGHIEIVKKKIKYNEDNLKKDFNTSAKEECLVYHTNEHSQGYYYRFLWFKTPVKGIKKFSFIPTRTNKRNLAKAIKSNNIKY
jgi:hypothetical protein